MIGLEFDAAGIQFCGIDVQLWTPQIVQAMGFSTTIVGFLVALPFVFAAAGMVLWGYSSDVRGERIWHIALAALFTASGLVVASVSSSDLIVLAGLIMAVVGQFSALPVINSMPPSFLRGPALAGGIALCKIIDFRCPF